MGAMTFGSKLEQCDAERVLDEALDNGVNFIDTADSYGQSEEILGRILNPEKRNRVFLATKVFRRYCRDEHVGRNSRVNIISSLERSLNLMKTDCVDLYQLHHPDPITPLEETLQTLDTLIRAGKIRYIGVSNHYAWQMATMLGESKAHGWEPIVSLQANYDILDRQIELETVPFLNKLNIALMCYGPLCGGILTGKYKGGESIPEGSRAEQSRKLREYLEDNVVEDVLDGLVELTESSDFTMNQVAILWLLSKPHATSIILGGSKPDHFSQIYEVADEALPEEVTGQIDKLSGPRIHSVYRNQPITTGAPLGVQW